MRLRHYWASGGVVEFDPATGKVRRSAAGDVTDWGFVWKQRRRWFVLRHDDESLIFQHRAETWRLRSDVELSVSGDFRREFQISRDGRQEFSFRYGFRGTLFVHIDPTYDAIDEESDDFFVYVTSMWAYWKDRSADEFIALIGDD